jgi:hypothetical protein
MIASGRYKNTATMIMWLVAEVQQAGADGLAATAVRAAVGDERWQCASDTLSRLVAAGRIHGVGYRVNRRWFLQQADALAWDRNGRPRTEAERRAAVLTAPTEEREARRAARLAKLALPRRKHIRWTDDQVKTLRREYPRQGVQAVARMLGLDAERVRSKVWALRLKCEVRPAPVRPSRSNEVAQAGVAPSVRIARVRGPADMDGPVSFHPNFKFTRCPSPGAALRTNTHSVL